MDQNDALDDPKGPKGDEWDSPGYHHFWDRTEQARNKRLIQERESREKTKVTDMSEIELYAQEDRIVKLEAEIGQLKAALLAFVAAARDVQEHWSDPGAYTHNRLLTPMLVHEDTIRALEQTGRPT